MIFSDSLEVAIGLTFIFLMLSLALTPLNEMVEMWTKSRARFLYDGITELIADPIATVGTAARDDGYRTAYTVALYSHPKIQGLFRGTAENASANAELPSYIPVRNFAQAVIEQTLAGKFGDATTTARLPQSAPEVDRLRLAAERIASEQLRRAVIGAIEVGQGDIDRVRTDLERWYGSATDRISGKYKRRTQKMLFVTGLLVAFLLNVNTLTIADRLAKDATLRRAIVEQASAGSTADPLVQIEHVGLPIGWERSSVQSLVTPIAAPEASANGDWRLSDNVVQIAFGIVQIVAGFLITAFAVTLGAPFWFDVLNRLMVIRATVKPTEKSKDEAPQDPQPARGGGTTVVVETQVPTAHAAAVGGASDDDILVDPNAPDRRLMEDDEGRGVDKAGPEDVA